LPLPKLAPPRCERVHRCPVFDCTDNKDFVCKDRGKNYDIPIEAVRHGVSPGGCRTIKTIESCPTSSTFRCLTLDENGDDYMFVTYIPGQGLFRGIVDGRDNQLCAIKYTSGQLSNINFYYDKVLKWIQKNQPILPGCELGEKLVLR
jgi:hypothetical protein